MTRTPYPASLMATVQWIATVSDTVQKPIVKECTPISKHLGLLVTPYFEFKFNEIFKKKKIFIKS